MIAVRSRWRSPALALAIALFALPPAAAGITLEEHVKQCGACHGGDGNSRMERIPSLAGQPEFFLFNQLFLMREGVRRIQAMAPFVKDLSDRDIEGLAKHYAGQTPRPSDERVDAAQAARGADLAAQRRCGSCHGPGLEGQEQMPRLAKQRIDYTLEALKAFRDNRREGADTLMAAAVYGLRDAELAGLAHYAGSK